MAELSKKSCVPCRAGAPKLKKEEIENYLTDLEKDWKVVDNHHLYKKFNFPDFISTLNFVNKIGEIAEEEGHHPNICFTWGIVEVKIWTHKIDGLHENDFILAAKIDKLV